MDYNLHTHTFRCNHAEGSDEEYVLTAIERGVKRLGFSDHIPLVFEDGFESNYRVKAKDADDYVTSVLLLREKYKKEIEILLGFESEYYPEYFDKMVKYAKNLGIEYLILGQHFAIPEHPERKSHYSYSPTKNIDLLVNYCDSVVNAIKTGVFTYVAHPDLFYFTGEKDEYIEQMSKICEASKKYDIPLEINFLGIRDNRIYPNKDFWEVAGKIGSPVTFGADAHKPNGVVSLSDVSVAKEMVKEFNLNYIGCPKIKKL